MRRAAVNDREPTSILREFGGACGDLGTFIPHVIGAMTVAGLAPVGVLFGFGVFLISTGLFYGLPMPVQPMKAVSAVILTDGLHPGEVAAAGLMLGLVLLVLGITGWIGRLARMIPQSVSAGLQLGLGLLMGVLGIKLVLETPWTGFGSLAALLLLSRIPRCPAAPIVLGAAAVVGWMTNGLAVHEIGFSPSLPQLVLPTWTEVWRSFEIAVIPQLSLTLTNAVIVTASLSRELFPASDFDCQRTEFGAVVGSRQLVALSARRDADVPRRRWITGPIPLWRANRPDPDYSRGYGAGAGARLCGSHGIPVLDYPNRGRWGVADPRWSRLGNLPPLVRW